MKNETIKVELEKLLQLPSIQMFRVPESEPEDWQIETDKPSRLHLHDSWEVKILYPGSVFYHHNDVLNVEKPMVLFIPPRCLHVTTYHEDLGSSGSMLAFTSDSTYFCIGKRTETDTEEFVLSSQNLKKLNRLCLVDWTLIVEQMSRNLDREILYDIDGYNLYLFKFFISALIECNIEDKSNYMGVVIDNLGAVAKAKYYIKMNYFRADLSVKEVAEFAGVSLGHLSVLFKSSQSGKVRQYLIMTRLKKALDLLKTGSYSVKEVSMQTGWQNQLYFSKRFRKYYGYPPSQVNGGSG